MGLERAFLVQPAKASSTGLEHRGQEGMEVKLKETNSYKCKVLRFCYQEAWPAGVCNL